LRPSIDDYFLRFLREHLARHPRVGLPALGTDEGDTLFGTWRKLLAEIDGVSYEALTAASERMVAEPASDRRHFTVLAAFTRQAILARRAEGKRYDLSTREGAEFASKCCDRCGGTGVVSVFRRPPVPEGTPSSVAAHCVCALGRWMRRALERAPAVLERIPDLDAVLVNRIPWTTDPPR